MYVCAVVLPSNPTVVVNKAIYYALAPQEYYKDNLIGLNLTVYYFHCDSCQDLGL